MARPPAPPPERPIEVIPKEKCAAAGHSFAADGAVKEAHEIEVSFNHICLQANAESWRRSSVELSQRVLRGQVATSLARNIFFVN